METSLSFSNFKVYKPDVDYIQIIFVHHMNVFSWIFLGIFLAMFLVNFILWISNMLKETVRWGFILVNFAVFIVLGIYVVFTLSNCVFVLNLWPIVIGIVIFIVVMFFYKFDIDQFLSCLVFSILLFCMFILLQVTALVVNENAKSLF